MGLHQSANVLNVQRQVSKGRSQMNVVPFKPQSRHLLHFSKESFTLGGSVSLCTHKTSITSIWFDLVPA